MHKLWICRHGGSIAGCQHRVWRALWAAFCFQLAGSWVEPIHLHVRRAMYGDPCSRAPAHARHTSKALSSSHTRLLNLTGCISGTFCLGLKAMLLAAFPPLRNHGARISVLNASKLQHADCAVSYLNSHTPQQGPWVYMSWSVHQCSSSGQWQLLSSNPAVS